MANPMSIYRAGPGIHKNATSELQIHVDSEGQLDIFHLNPLLRSYSKTPWKELFVDFCVHLTFQKCPA